MSRKSRPRLFGFIILLSALFFAWGLTTATIKLSVDQLKSAFDTTLQQALLVKFSFFLAYAFLGVLSGLITSKLGFKAGLKIGLCLIISGILYLIPATMAHTFSPILPAFFIIGCGVTFLQVSANPLAAGFGDPDRAAQRLNFVQGFNAFGAFCGPFFAGVMIYRESLQNIADTAAPVRNAMLLLAAALLFLLILIWRTPFKTSTEDILPEEAFQMEQAKRLPLRVYFGALAIFLYVGAEVSVASTLVSFFAQTDVLTMSSDRGVLLASLFFGGAFLGRFAGASIIPKFGAPKVLVTSALMAVICALGGLSLTGWVAAGMVLALGLFNAVQFPTIFALSIEQLGPKRKALASGIICTGVVGGGLVPQLFGWLSDTHNMHIAFVVPAFCYLYIAVFAALVRRPAGTR